MISYTIRHKKIENLKKAQEKYPWLFLESLSDESREVRFLLLEFLEERYGYRGNLEKSLNGKPIPIITSIWQVLYWSISHSDNFLAYSLSDTPTGIDIAEFQERDISLLDTHSKSEYQILWGVNWNNFYLLWTAKEAIIKAYWNSLDQMNSIMLRDVFWDGRYSFEFENKRYTIQSILEREYRASFIC